MGQHQGVEVRVHPQEVVCGLLRGLQDAAGVGQWVGEDGLPQLAPPLTGVGDIHALEHVADGLVPDLGPSPLVVVVEAVVDDEVQGGLRHQFLQLTVQAPGQVRTEAYLVVTLVDEDPPGSQVLDQVDEILPAADHLLHGVHPVALREAADGLHVHDIAVEQQHVRPAVRLEGLQRRGVGVVEIGQAQDAGGRLRLLTAHGSHAGALVGPPVVEGGVVFPVSTLGVAVAGLLVEEIGDVVAGQAVLLLVLKQTYHVVQVRLPAQALGRAVGGCGHGAGLHHCHRLLLERSL